jgi:ammonia channel protein AmtB
VSAIVYFAISILMYRMKLDDPLDAVGSHAGGGIVGLVTLGIAMNCLST